MRTAVACLVVILATSAAFATSAAHAQGTANQPASRQGQDTPDRQERICKAEHATGTRVGNKKRICMTRAEWDDVARRNAQDVKNRQGSNDTRQSLE